MEVEGVLVNSEGLQSEALTGLGMWVNLAAPDCSGILLFLLRKALVSLP